LIEKDIEIFRHPSRYNDSMKTTTGFHLCPLDPRVEKLFERHPERLTRRIPIAERARIARKELSISYAEALGLCQSKSFTANGSRFVLLGRPEQTDTRLTALVISHFGSILQGAFVAIGIRPDASGHPVVSIFATTEEKNLPRDFSSLDVNPEDIMFTEFEVIRGGGRMWGRMIKSNQKGLGGRIMAARYNLARDLGLKTIRYEVAAENIQARQVFFHADFGKPENDSEGGIHVVNVAD
jgi:hypothetical protein